MRGFLWFLLGLVTGALAVFALFNTIKNGIGSNAGSEFYGSEFTEALRGSGKGVGNNSGSKFFGDLYIKEILSKKDNA